MWWGTANPAPLYDWSGPDWKTNGARPGDNLYTTSVILLDPDTGKLKGHHQELPHDAWDFDSSTGEFIMLERGGKKYVVHPSKSGFVWVYDRQGKVQNVWRLVKHINFVKDITKTGELIGRRDFTEGKHTNLCPFIAGGMSWNMGSYNSKTGLLYKVGNEWCIDLTIEKTTPVLEPMAQLNIGANFNLTHPQGDKAHGHVSARDPITGTKKWEIKFDEPPLASLLSTGGNLLFVPDARGWLRAYDAGNGKELWKHNNGQGHNGGIISYKVGNKQYVAVMTGWGGLAGDDYGAFFGGTFAPMPKDSGIIKVVRVALGICAQRCAGSLSVTSLERRVFAFAFPIQRPMVRAFLDQRIGGTIAASAFACSAAFAQTDKPGPMQSGQHVKPAGATTASPIPATESKIVGPADVNKLFATSCGWCHNGGGRDAGKGPKLMDSELTDAELASKIRNGKIGQMPAFKGQLTDD